jgi:hypothetical protein
MAVVSVPWRVMPGVVMMRRRRVPVSRGVVPRVVVVVRRWRVSVPWRVVPGVVMVVRRGRGPVPWRVMPRVMVVRLRPVMGVMTPPGLVCTPTAVMETPRMPLAHAVPGRQRGWLRRLRGRVAAGTTSTERQSGAAARRS